MVGITGNILLEWNILANPVIWLVNQARNMSTYPRGSTGAIDRISKTDREYELVSTVKIPNNI
jgi:hypothetical protein